MALPAGTRIAHFEVVAPLGAGGMGEVYRARDRNLGRDVALKVLPDEVARDPSRLARFEREARATAALSHPNILVVYEVGVADPVPFVAAELLDGHTLADEMHRPLGVTRTLDYAAQIAKGLAAAHDKGIVHRDIKPANLFVTRDGVVKILDFGIAKAMSPDNGGATVTAPLAVVGTGGYMAPEQVRGGPIDGRVDLFALGVVCYEALTGRRAFAADSAAESLAAVLREDPPDLREVAPDVPPGIARIVHRCLAKEPAARFQSARDLAFALESAPRSDAIVPAPPVSTNWRWGAVAAAAVVAAGLIGSRLTSTPAAAPPAGATRRLVVSLPHATALSSDVYVPFALSPDGATLAYTTAQPERLYLRRLDDFVVKVVSGSEGAFDPFYSPDGQWMGFWSQGEIRKASLAGGPAVVVCKAVDMIGASWDRDGRIVFAPGRGSGLSTVPAAGGTPQPLTTLDAERGEFQHVFPQVLDDGRVLFTAQRAARDEPFSVELLDPASNRRQTVVDGARYGRLLPTGHLTFKRGRSLMAVKVSGPSLTPQGPPVVVLEDVHETSAGAAQVSVGGDGTLAYLPFVPPETRRFVWVDRSGSDKDLGLPPRAYGGPRLSPDGRQIAVRVFDPPDNDIWLASTTSATLQRLTFNRRLEFTYSQQAFSPDGATVTYSGDAPQGASVTSLPVDGRTSPRHWLTWPRPVSPQRVTKNGDLILVTTNAGTGADLVFLAAGAEQPTPIVEEAQNQWGSALSPDERHLAYAGEESGRYEIYVTPIPGPGPKRQLTTDGGREAVWSRNGREIFYRNAGRVMALPVDPASGAPLGPPKALFEDRFVAGAAGAPGYDVAPDGRLLMLRAVSETPRPELRVVLNWFDELRRLVP